MRRLRGVGIGQDKPKQMLRLVELDLKQMSF